MNPEEFLRIASIVSLPLITAITLHEWAHGWVASLRGDNSAKMLGRISLNPARHIDPIGTLLVPISLIVLNIGLIFGWAKPVPVNTSALKNPRFDMALVAIAGPIANIIMAIMWGLAGKFAGSNNFGLWLTQAANSGVILNIFLAVLNMLPIPPLDGGRILSAFLPRRIVYYYDQLEPYGFFILIGLMATNSLSGILQPTIHYLLIAISRLLEF